MSVNVKTVRRFGWALSLALVGCATSGRVAMVPTNVAIADRKPLNVAIVVPDASRAVATVEWEADACLSSGNPTGPFGDIFVQTVNDRFGRLFESVRVVRSVPEAAKADAVFEATLTRLTYKSGCMVSPQAGFAAYGGLRALAPDGREVWRSPRTRNGVEYQGLANTLNLGGDVARRLGGLVDDWVMDLQALPIARYAPDSASAVASAAPSAVPGRNGKAFPTTPVAVEFSPGRPHPDDIAVIIGNADYGRLGKDIPDVVPAYADAESFKRYVMAARGVREGNIIELRDATGAQMERVFGSERTHEGQLFNWVLPGVSNVYVYFAGHGAPGARDGAAYLVPSDADATAIAINGFPLDVLYANLAKLPARSITVVLEACFSGNSQGGSVIPRASGIHVKPRAATIPGNLTVIAAGAADQMASWENDSSHGLFTKYYLTGMGGAADMPPYGNGDGRVATAEIEAYLGRTLTYYARRYYGRDQQARIVTPH